MISLYSAHKTCTAHINTRHKRMYITTQYLRFLKTLLPPPLKHYCPYPQHTLLPTHTPSNTHNCPPSTHSITPTPQHTLLPPTPQHTLLPPTPQHTLLPPTPSTHTTDHSLPNTHYSPTPSRHYCPPPPPTHTTAPRPTPNTHCPTTSISPNCSLCSSVSRLCKEMRFCALLVSVPSLVLYFRLERRRA